MNRKIIHCMVIALFLLLPAVRANADSSSLFRYAGTVQPVQNNNVRMVEEEVYIQVYAGWSVVRCEFVFKNESREAQDVLMGFPASMIGIEPGMIDATTRLRNFKVYDNGAEIESKLEKDGINDDKEDRIAEWYTWNIRFQGEEERKIVNTYKTQNYNAPWERRSGYILKTGAPWKDTIGKATITFELMDIAPSRISPEYTAPKGFRIDQNKVIWEMHDFEPAEDIKLSLSGYVPVSQILLGQDPKQNDIVKKSVEQARTLFMDGNEQEGLMQANSLLKQGIYVEELYFLLLGYYHKQNDADSFIRIMKEQIANLNSPNILEWAKALYPERLKNENITYPDKHKPSLQNQMVRKLDENYFEIGADLHDEARDMTYLSITAYADALTMDSLLLDDGIRALFGLKNYTYRGKGKLPDAYSDLVSRMEVTDYKGDAAFGESIDPNRPGESCYFYTGSSFEMWNIIKDGMFTLCYYDKSFDSMEAEFRKTLSSRLNSLKNKLDISIPNCGYVINLYEKSHMAGLKRGIPQTITKYLKRPEYDAKRHNERIDGQNKGQDLNWAWGELIIELDGKNTENMIQSVLQQVMKDQFGENWQQIDSKASGEFIAATLGEPGKGRYYEAFSNMTNDELKSAAKSIGMTGKIEVYAASDENKHGLVIVPVLLFALSIGSVIFMFIRKRISKA